MRADSAGLRRSTLNYAGCEKITTASKKSYSGVNVGAVVDTEPHDLAMPRHPSETDTVFTIGIFVVAVSGLGLGGRQTLFSFADIVLAC